MLWAAYPDHNKQFDIYTGASDFHLGACIVQEGRPVAYFSHKISKFQCNNTVMEKEMLSIVVPLKNFKLFSLVQIFMFLPIITLDL
jgi:hypothetical protein